MPILLAWLQESEPDVVALQETKVEDDKFPRAEIEALGYHVSVHGQKSYNGVAILSKLAPNWVQTGLGEGWPVDCRVITAAIAGIRFINTYVPNGNTVGSEKWVYKMAWLDHFPSFVHSLPASEMPTIWLGDINIAPTADDVFESAKHLGNVGHHPDEFTRLDRIRADGWQDAFREHHPGPGHYTFWDFRLPRSLDRNLGWRIDHIYMSPNLHGTCSSIQVDRDTRGMERPSDHAPVVAEIRWP